MKRCTNCGAENLDDAKFCRVCGSSLSNMPLISWKDTNLVKTKHSLGFYILIVLVIILLIYSLYDEVNTSKPADLSEITFALSIILLIPIIIMFFSQNNKTKELRNVASAIEDTFVNCRLITKSGKYGLYDWDNKKVLLKVDKDSIERQNDFYYTVKKDGKYGVYNRISHSFIVPCEYDFVTPFVNNEATVVKGNETKRVDTQGNFF